MTISVQTNVAALVALQNLNKTASELQGAQNQISTGLAISSAKDNASVWAIAQGQRAEVGALSAVKSSLDRDRARQHGRCAGRDDRRFDHIQHGCSFARPSQAAAHGHLIPD